MRFNSAKPHRRIRSYLHAILQRCHNESEQLGSELCIPAKEDPFRVSKFQGGLSTSPEIHSCERHEHESSPTSQEQIEPIGGVSNPSKRILFASRSNLSLFQCDRKRTEHKRHNSVSSASSIDISSGISHEIAAQSSTNSSRSGEELSVLRTTPVGSVSLPSTPNTSISLQLLSPLSQLAHRCQVRNIYQHGTSLQGSLATISTGTSSIRSDSTLKLRRSRQNIGLNEDQPTATFDTHDKPLEPPLKERFALLNLDAKPMRVDNDTKDWQQNADITMDERHEDARRSCSNHFKHYRSFCVLDAARPGYPVTAVSHDLKDVFEIGDRWCVDAAEIDCMDTDTIIAEDQQGHLVLYLILYNPLINPGSGRNRFVFATILDISHLMMEDTYYPATHHSTEEFAGNVKSKADWPRDDVWFDIASEETQYPTALTSAPTFAGTRKKAQSQCDPLDEFLEVLQDVYFDFFLLGKSPLDDNSYEICNVSISLYDDREYVDGHLTHTSAEMRIILEDSLRRDSAFSIPIRWGQNGSPRQLHCNPLFGKTDVTWLCFLVANPELVRMLD